MAYQTGKVYKIECEDGHFYIGSTKNDLKVRLEKHKTNSKLCPTYPLYKHIGNDWNKVRIELVEDYPCNDRRELEKREDDYIQKEIDNSLCLNHNRSFRTDEYKKEYASKHYEENKETYLGYSRSRYETHTDECKEYAKQYYQDNITRCKEYASNNYYAKRNTKLSYAKNYYQANRDKILERRRQRKLNQIPCVEASQCAPKGNS